MSVGVHMRRGAFAIMIGVSSCGPAVADQAATEGDGSEAADVSAGTTTGSPMSSDDEGLLDGTDTCDFELIGCFGEFPCRNIWLGDGDCDELPPGVGPRFHDPQCILNLLQQGTVSSFHVNECRPDGTGFRDTVTILGDGTALLIRSFVTSEQFGEAEHYPPRRVIMRPPHFFENCLVATDFETVRECLLEWFIPDECLPEACCPVENNSNLPPC